MNLEAFFYCIYFHGIPKSSQVGPLKRETHDFLGTPIFRNTY
jgi:hypothetical protein